MAATTLPRTPRASFNTSHPPTSALPALPSLNPRASTQNLRRSSLLPQTPGRPSASYRPTTPSLSVPTNHANGKLPAPRRAASIASFSHAARNGGSIITSLPPPSPFGSSRRDNPSPLASPTRLTYSEKPLSKLNTSRHNPSANFNSAFVGGIAEDGSPPPSRSSSAEGSYSTNATTVDASPTSGDEFGGRGRKLDQDEKETKGNVIVSVRVRPDGPEGGGANPDWMVDGRYGKIGVGGKDGGVFEFDNVFLPTDNNSRVYDACAKRLVRRVMEGYHGTVFAYGMTGTGKTFSMQGTTSSPGVIPLAITDIFSFIRETPHREFLLRVSYLEIYNERIHDLLASEPGGKGFVPLDQQTKGEEIKLREDAKRGVYATPLKEEIVQSPTQLLRVIARGDLARRVGSTQFNARSSRSHAVVQIVVESRDRKPGAIGGGDSMSDNRRAGITGGVRVSTLSLIDLAGSERAAENKERRQEGAHINRSLLTLGTVIARISSDGNGKDKDGNHLPYRDSKLTRLLQPALSGNSLVSILCTIAVPQATANGAVNATNASETMNTLKFAARARNNIVSHAKKADESIVGGVDAGSRVLLERYRMEIMELRSQLESQKKKDDDDMRDREEREREERDAERHSEQMLEMQLARTALKERIEHLNRLILCSKSSGVNSPRASMIIGGGGHMSALSVRSSMISNAGQSSLSRTMSQSSSISTINGVGSDGDGGEEESAGEFGDGSATLAAQVRALQADVADKNRYIVALEKRLLQARRSSQSRTSIGCFSPPRFSGMIGGELIREASLEFVLKEKDEEIADLRARLDDKEKMVSALRSAARKREVAEGGRRGKSFDATVGRNRDSRRESLFSSVRGSVTSMGSRTSAVMRLAQLPNDTIDETF